MFLEYNKDFFIFVDSISCSSFANPNIILYSALGRLVYLKASGYKVLHTGGFLLTCQLKLNRVFFSDQPVIISSHCQVFDTNSQYRTHNNNHFIAKQREKASCIYLPTKVVAICISKKASYYCQNNDWDSKLLPVRLDQYIM